MAGDVLDTRKREKGWKEIGQEKTTQLLSKRK